STSISQLPRQCYTWPGTVGRSGWLPSTSTVTRRRKFYYSMWANPCLNRLDRRPYPHHSRPYQMDRASLEMRERGTAMTPKLVTVTRGELLARRSDVLEQDRKSTRLNSSH